MSRQKRESVYILIQHSGFTEVGNPQFMNAVEVYPVNLLPSHVEALRSKGIHVFDSYLEAYEMAYRLNFPDENISLIPSIGGKWGWYALPQSYGAGSHKVYRPEED